uniref:Transposase IS200-like domain-containing protein n=1 Tax=Leptospirillum ferriphilum TaxID=178606 RepID=A0A7C3LU52_9BACT
MDPGFPSSVCPKTPFDRKIPQTPDAFVHARSGLPLTSFSPFGESGSVHVHLFAEIPPALNVSTPVNNLKTASARRVPDRFPIHPKPIDGKPSFRYRACATGSAGRETPETVFRRAESQGTREKPRHVKSSPCPHLHCSQERERLFPSWRRSDSVLRQTRLQAPLPSFCPEKDTRSEAVSQPQVTRTIP